MRTFLLAFLLSSSLLLAQTPAPQTPTSIAAQAIAAFSTAASIPHHIQKYLNNGLILDLTVETVGVQ
jgi:hypothetical protein